MRYKLLALDLDGTLTNGQKQITPYTLRTLLEAQEMGVKIALASGRPTYGITPIADLLQLHKYGGFVLSFNGAEITNWQTKEIIYQQPMDTSFLPFLYQCAKQNNLAIETFNGKYVISETPEDQYVQLEAAVNHITPLKVPDFLKAIDFPVLKCLIVGEGNRLAILEKEMKAVLDGKLGVFRSEPFFLEFVSKEVDKAQTLSILLKKLNMQREELVAVGDGYNDVSMIQFAGLGVAMANAQETVRRHAAYITLSNEDDGVADLVVKLIRGEL